jgi:hypothetical protein
VGAGKAEKIDSASSIVLATGGGAVAAAAGAVCAVSAGFEALADSA